MPYIQFQFRRGLASEWTSANPVLAAGEMGIETDTHKIKIGNGTTNWGLLTYGLFATDLQLTTAVGATTNIAVSITNTTVSSNTVTGALTVSGGVGVGGNFNLGGNASVTGKTTVGNIIYPTSNNTINIGTPTARFGTIFTSGNSLDLGGTLLSANLGNLYVNNVLVISGNNFSVSTGNFSTSLSTPTVLSNSAAVNVGTSATIVDQFAVGTYTTAKYIIQSTNGSNYHSTEAFLVNDGTNAYLTVYASVTNNIKLINLDADISGGNVRLRATGTGAGNSVKVFSTKI